MIRNKRLKEKLTTLINDLMMDYPAGYLILALKQISDQQLLHLNIDTKQIIRDPILKVYELTVSELEEVLFDPNEGVQSNEDLADLILYSLKEIEDRGNPVTHH